MGLWQTVSAQVTFRNDFVINGKEKKIKNRGLTFISINLSQSHPNWNYLFNGRGGNTLLIDVAAIKNPRKKYSYSEVAERIYAPNVITGPIIHPVPLFLLMPPPHVTMPVLNLHVRSL